MTDKKDMDDTGDTGVWGDSGAGQEVGPESEIGDIASSGRGRLVLIVVLVLAVSAGSLLVWRQIDRPSFENVVDQQFSALKSSISPAKQAEAPAPQIEPTVDESADLLAGRVGRLGDQQTAMLQAVDRLTAVLDRLEGRISALEGASQDATRIAEQSRLTTQQLAAQQLAAQQMAAQELSAQDQVTQLEQRLAEVEARTDLSGAVNRNGISGEYQQITGLAGLALVQLRRAADQGRPFKAELENLDRLLTPEDAGAVALANLKVLGASATPTLATLSGNLSRLAPAIVRSGTRAATDEAVEIAEENWWDGVASRFAGLVTVRRIGDVAGDDPEALVARAEVRLAQNDLASAVELLNGIESGDADSASPSGKLARWLADAERRIALDHALSAIEAALAADWAEKQSMIEPEPEPESGKVPVSEDGR